MSLTYQKLCAINRAIDTFLHPHTFSYLKCLQGLRVLYDSQKYKTTHKLIPSVKEIQDRLHNLSIPIVNENDVQTLNELMDTSIAIGVPYRDILNNINHQQIEWRETVRVPVQPTSVNNDSFSLKNISNDKQNVHHSQINEHIKKVVIQLCKDYPQRAQNSLWANYLNLLEGCKTWNNKNEKSIQFIKDSDVSFGIGITLADLFLSLMTYIQLHKHKNELLDRLNEELADMSGTCSTGHMSRLVNVIQGFTERYKIELNPEIEIRKHIFNYMNYKLSLAPDYIQEGIIDKTEPFMEFVENQKAGFIKKFGNDHKILIDKILMDYIKS